MVDAVGPTSLAALRARMASLQAELAQGQPRPTALRTPTEPAPPARTLTPGAGSHKPGSVESENVQQALGMAKAARTNIETLTLGVGSYNGATRMLADTARIEDLRRRGGDKAVEMYVRGHQQIQRSALMLINAGAGKMAAEFTIAGTPVTKTEDGSYRLGAYVQSTGGGGWSVSVRSTGQALAVANGVDVSNQVDDSSSSGFKWSSLGQSVDVAI